GIEVRGADGRRQAAEQSYEDQDGGGNTDCAKRNIKVDVAFTGGVFVKRAVKGKRSDGRRRSIGEANANDSANGGDDQRFGQELQLDVPAAGAQGAAQTNLPDALFHAH